MNDTDTDPGTEAGTDTSPPPAAPPRLVRLPEEGHWLGVAAGLARHFRIDPVIPRIAFVVLTFTGGLGIVLYLALWLVMPEEHETTTPGETAAQRLRDAPSWLPAALIVLGVLWLAGIVGFSAPGLVWGLALIGLGILLFQQDGSGQGAATAATVLPPPPGAHPGAGFRPPVGAHAAGTAASGTPVRPVAPPDPPEPPPPPSILGRLTFAVGLLAIGLVALVSNLGGAALGPRTYLAIGLAVVGAGLIVGAWWGRARGLIVVGLLLIPMALATGVRGVPVVTAGGIGDRYWQPQTIDELRGEYNLLAGEAELDLTRLTFPSGSTTTVTGNVMFGEFTVVVPDDIEVAVVGSVIAGEVVTFGSSDSGLFVDIGRGVTTAGADLVVELRGGFGQLNVVQSPSEQTRLR